MHRCLWNFVIFLRILFSCFPENRRKKNLRRWFFSRQFFYDSITNWCWFSSFWSLCRGLDTAANNNNNDWPSLVMFPHIFTSKFSFSLDLSVRLLWGRKRFSSLQHKWRMVLDSNRGGNPGDLSPFPTFLASELIELVYFVIQTKITTMYNPWVEKFFLVCYPHYQVKKPCMSASHLTWRKPRLTCTATSLMNNIIDSDTILKKRLNLFHILIHSLFNTNHQKITFQKRNSTRKD